MLTQDGLINTPCKDESRACASKKDTINAGVIGLTQLERKFWPSLAVGGLYIGIHSPFAMVVESVDALVAVATVTAAFVYMKLAEEAESLIGRRSCCSFALMTPKSNKHFHASFRHQPSAHDPNISVSYRSVYNLNFYIILACVDVDCAGYQRVPDKQKQKNRKQEMM